MYLVNELAEFRKASSWYDRSKDDLKFKMREHFQSLGKEGMKMELRVLETGTLITMCDDIAVIENENYEICKAINKVLEERKDLI